MILRRNSSSLFVVFLLIVLSLIVLFLSSRVVKGIKVKNEINVKVCKVQSGNVQDQIDVRVIVKSQNYKEYYGNQLRIRKLYVKHGDYVEKGKSFYLLIIMILLVSIPKRRYNLRMLYYKRIKC